MQIVLNDNREFSKSVVHVGFKGENKANVLEFVFPDYLNEFGKKLCFETTNGECFTKMFDDIISNNFTLTRDIMLYKEIKCSVEFFKTDNEDDIVYKTSNLTLIILPSVQSGDIQIAPEETKIINDLIFTLENNIKQTNNLDLVLSKENDVTSISITKKDGSIKNENIFDGKDATINGKNAIEIEAGKNVNIEETENGIKINVVGGGSSGGAVDSVNGKTGDVTLNAEDVGALPNTTKIPTKTSDLKNDSNFIDKTYHDNTKVDKEEGKGLSTNDYTNEDKDKLSSLQNYDDTQVKSDIDTINSKIPTQATNSNQLADKDFVNSSLNSITAFYITKNADGDQFNSKSELDSATEFYSGGEVRIPTRNDYCIVLEDETKDNSTTRYIYQNGQWEFQYIVNETPLTSEQVKAINSGITPELVAKLQGINLTDYVKNTDYATQTKAGIIRYNSTYGMQAIGNTLAPLGWTTYADKRQGAFMSYAILDYSVKAAMCDGKGADWTDEEKASARTRMGVPNHITLTQAEYDALVEAGTVDENTYYYIKEE